MSKLNRMAVLWFVTGAIAASACWYSMLSGDPPTNSAHAASPAPAIAATFGATDPLPDDGKLRIICFGAHPDDNELKAPRRYGCPSGAAAGPSRSSSSR